MKGTKEACEYDIHEICEMEFTADGTLLLFSVSNIMKGVVCFCSIAYLYDRTGHLE